VHDLETHNWQPQRVHLLWLTAALALVLAPHAMRIPLWVATSFVALALWRMACAFGLVRFPGRWLRVLVSLLLFLGIAVSFGTIFGKSAGVAALVVLAGLKLLETATLRDAYALSFLGYFLVVTNFLFSQSVLVGAYMFVAVVAMTAALTALNAGTTSPLERLQTAGALLLQALPVMLVLFVLFPRIPGPLWGLPKDAHSGLSGLSDKMSPGDISQLGLSGATAFRVKFDGQPPENKYLYWRGPILWRTDGRTWTQGETKLVRHLGLDAHVGEPLDYLVTLEPHQRTWLFALDMPVAVPPGKIGTTDFQLRSIKPVRKRIQYRARSYAQYRTPGISGEDFRRALELPVGAHPKARELALKWRNAGLQPDAVVAAALAYFRNEPFFYTLRPPRLDGDNVDQFLFGSRQGFCEHFAASFTVLMRAAGIPARVVTGYQGGERNPLGDYLMVRQRDAHAWAEVWISGRGWVRVDPTAAVAPERIELGLEAAIPAVAGTAILGIEAGDAVLDVMRTMRNAWDSLNNSWNLWVLGYGPQRQMQLLSRIGLDASDWRKLVLWLGSAVLGLMVATGLLLMRRPGKRDPALRAYTRFCNRLARQGMPRRPSEGPLDYARRINARRPDLCAWVDQITELYVDIRYAGGRGDVGDLKRAAAAFRP